jgi:hypothetical protein
LEQSQCFIQTRSIQLCFPLSSCLAIPPPFPSINHPHFSPRAQCQLQLSPAYAVFSSLLSFFLPATLMLFLYYRLYLYARRHVRSIQAQLKQASANRHPINNQLCERSSPCRQLPCSSSSWPPIRCAKWLSGRPPVYWSVVHPPAFLASSDLLTFSLPRLLFSTMPSISAAAPQRIVVTSAWPCTKDPTRPPWMPPCARERK